MPFIINSLFKIFLSTLSLRRATWLVSYSAPSLLYFYPRSPCGERRQHRQSNPAGHRISIHALLAESDKSSWSLTRLNRNISIHALLAESDGLGFCYHCDDVAFLSTLSLRRATVWCQGCPVGVEISIHALLAESDGFFFCLFVLDNRFLSTLSLRRATFHVRSFTSKDKFLSTLSLRRATDRRVNLFRFERISIHALLAESDSVTKWTATWNLSFLSTLSLRRATTSGR